MGRLLVLELLSSIREVDERRERKFTFKPDLTLR
jgi:hypothetical protein